ncbi:MULTISPECIES: CopD family protein [Sphingobacterium]|uniref:Protoporphyrinogen IX oxidase n=1 Tax=Sphingobacterium kitahiroshimense TaxID=470446 RepID=A0ABV0BVE6_9SPHI|nr:MULTISPECIES: CopD family protein [Sphingobacterium]MBB2953645.1 putative membrane protein [Sphingobacterium sp. JUb56]MCW2262708.1 putative membrane protein [Sphingobacterium kitahiroshimense]NJI73663.1 CopD family protein [Sphingobacterium sp. B16(2022)]QQD15987.1 CopD family protein [Sphingobacterium sp. UDSM-2020]TCR12299.1 putative membrane protein [Sphingobacterium sp. JUb78]
MIYLYAKAIHIIFVICWMAGLFYMPRLFIYHTEAKDQSKEAYTVLHKQFSIMENRLWWVITTPAMYITVFSALVMLYVNPSLLQMGWMHVKLLFVAAMIAYHFISQRMMFNLRDEKSTLSSSKLRMWNEVSTVLLFSIVFTVVLKSALNWIYGVVGLLSLAIVLMILIKAYKKYRTSREGK